MPKPFYALTVNEFAAVLDQYPFSRQINAVDMHHTWRPQQSQYVGQRTVENMWRYHTQDLGWSDNAQHLTIAPDGTIWTGRDWNRIPASARGHNGSSHAGPFMLEIIGDFDVDQDVFEGVQKEVVLEVIVVVQQHFHLPVESLRFHNQMSAKTCPGSSINRHEILAELSRIRAQEGGVGRCCDERENLFSGKSFVVNDILHTMRQTSRALDDPLDAELPEEDTNDWEIGNMSGLENATENGPAARGRGDKALEPAMLDALRGYVINLREGQFSDDGEYSTDASDVDRLFDERLPAAYQRSASKNKTLKIVFYAHGGLVSEKAGLQIAFNQVKWWQDNGVYPVFFVWETGLLETLSQLINSKKPTSRGPKRRDIFDYTTDPVIERLCRSLGAKKIWSGMKYSAAQAHVKPTGGGWYVAQKLSKFLADHSETELHAVGHSAGSIFHSHFIPTCLDLGVPPFKTLNLLAPAVTVAEFKSRIPEFMGADKGIDFTTIFTMKKDWEKADNTAQVYRKSLLYLVSRALEPDRKTPILGLEESLRKNSKVAKLFGLGRKLSSVGEVVWAKSKNVSGLNASRSVSHGGFDNDPSTMHSVVRRILDVGEEGAIEELPQSARELASRAIEAAQQGVLSPDDDLDWLFGVENIEDTPAIEQPPATSSPTVQPRPNKKALCIGINEYPNPAEKLGGCVADAKNWAKVFKALGYGNVDVVLDDQATRDGILLAIRNLISGAQSGDRISIQYSGHGTQATDYEGDEFLEGGNEGQNDGLDEALCPVDYAWEGLVIDDDLKELFQAIPDDVTVTCFFDCCHSATISRGIGGAGTGVIPREVGVKARFIRLDADAAKVHRKLREEVKLQRGTGRAPQSHYTFREITFSACRAEELALESHGQGHFTKHALQVLAQDIEGMTNADFMDRVIDAFGENPAQHPNMDSNRAAYGKPFLG